MGDLAWAQVWRRLKPSRQVPLPREAIRSDPPALGSPPLSPLAMIHPPIQAQAGSCWDPPRYPHPSPSGASGWERGQQVWLEGCGSAEADPGRTGEQERDGETDDADGRVGRKTGGRRPPRDTSWDEARTSQRVKGASVPPRPSEEHLTGLSCLI